MKNVSFLNRTQCGFINRLFVCIAILVSVTFTGFSQNFPFPQNYKYPYGQIYTASGTTVQNTNQSLYNSWKSTYYTEGTIGGTACARVKYIQAGETGTTTVSESIGSGMLIFVYMDNSSNSTQDEFNRLWAYYQKNANANGLMSSKVSEFTGQVVNSASNTSADIDVATALLLAHKQWGSSGTVDYITAAKNLINSIYTNEVDVNKLLKPGDSFNDYANPSYYKTNATTLFGKVEVSEGWQATDRWAAVTQASYNLIKTARNATSGLVPDWCATPSGIAISGIESDTYESYFLYDAIRIPWNMAQAYAWYGHADAKDIASKITTWSQMNYNDPASIWDGYLLNGSVFNNPTGNANFTTFGKNHNPCFSGGLSIGSMVDATYNTYMGKCWTVGSSNDPYGSSFTSTSQLLYMLTLSGNMPNLWDMKPVAKTAETNANGNIIYVDFSKDINPATTSIIGWTVSTYANDADVTPTNIPVSTIAIDATNAKRLAIALAQDIAEPIIKISYNGTLLAGTDASKVDAFGPFGVTNKITNGEPYVINRFANVLGTQVLIQWSKAIAPASINAAHFTVNIDGVSHSVGIASLDSNDPTLLILGLPNAISNSSKVLVSFTGNSILGVQGTKTALPFTNAPVQNFYMNKTCFILENFDSPVIAFASSGTGCTWSGTTADPASAQAGNVGKLVVSTNQTYHNVTGTLPAGQITGLNSALAYGNRILKFRMYVTNQHVTNKTVRVRIYKYDAADPYGWKDHMYFDFPVTTANAWVDYEYDFTSQYSAALQYDRITIEPSPEDASAETVYIDDIEFCPIPPVVYFVKGATSFDGKQVEVRFSSAMKVPALTDLHLNVDGVAQELILITTKQGDASVLVATLTNPIANKSSIITVAGGSEIVTVEDIPTEQFSGVIANLVGIAVTTGWRDDFITLTDNITSNLGTGGAFTGLENVTSPGTYTLTGNGELKWDPVSVSTYGTGATDLKQVMDLTGREKVQIRYRVPQATSTVLFLRIDVKDYVNGTTSDQFTIVQLPFTAGSTTFTDKTFDLNFKSIYGTPTGTVDKSNIQQVLFHFIEKEGTAANSYTPTNFKGKIEFDYISIGSAITLTGMPASVNQGLPITATSSATGQIFLVPVGTTPLLQALQNSVFAGQGVVVNSTANIATTIPTINLKAGYYNAYAYDPILGMLSAKVDVHISDVTAPIITQYDSGNIQNTGTISATVNEDAMLYVIPSSITNYSIASILDNAVYSIAATKDIKAVILISDIIPALALGSSYKFIAIDYDAVPNVSTVTSPNITIVSLNQIPVTNITLNETTLSLSAISAPVQLTATVAPVAATIKSVTWSSSNSSVASVSATGVVTPLSLGTTTIKATANDGSLVYGTCVVTVSAVVTESITVTPTQANLKVSETLALQVNVTPLGENDIITFISSNPLVASVNSNGLVTANGIGTAIITATLVGPNKTATSVITVSSTLVSEISIVPSTITLDPQEVATLTAVIFPSNATNKTIVWSSSNTNVALVNSQGIVTAIHEGVAEITATAIDGSSVVGTCEVTVNPSEVVPCTQIQVFANTSNVNCFGEQTGSIELLVNGGVAPYSYKWSNTSTESQIQKLGSGTYSVVISDNEGCSLVKNYTITESQKIEINPILEVPACGTPNGSITLQIIGGNLPFTFLWNNQEIGSSIGNLSAGNYSVEITDNYGCVVQKSIQLSNDGAPEITVESITESNCDASTGNVFLSVTGGATPYSYDWNDNNTSEDRSNLAPGKYSLEVSDNNACISFLEIEIPSTKLLEPSIALVTVSSETGKNLVVWQKEQTDLIDFYTVYRENNVAGQYDAIGTVPYASSSIFEDVTANPLERSWRYKISVTDVCGNESDLSESHKTIHLQKNIGLDNSINLDWDGYEGIYFSTYSIYRINTNGQSSLLSQLPSSITRYTDVNPLVDTKSYVVAIELPQEIDANEALLKLETGPFTLAMSNIAEVQTGIADVENGVKVYPTLVENVINVELGTLEGAKVSLVTANGETVYTKQVTENSIQIPTINFAKGSYTVVIQSNKYIKTVSVILK